MPQARQLSNNQQHELPPRHLIPTLRLLSYPVETETAPEAISVTSSSARSTRNNGPRHARGQRAATVHIPLDPGLPASRRVLGPHDAFHAQSCHVRVHLIPSTPGADIGRNYTPPQQPSLTDPNNSWLKKKVLGIWYAVIGTLSRPAYAVPFLLNVTGSIWFFILIGKAELSLTVPITNSLAFMFTVLGEWWAEKKVISRGEHRLGSKVRRC
jgi:hypothetical protein